MTANDLQTMVSISIHSPREGRDGYGLNTGVFAVKFQSTRPVRGETIWRQPSRGRRIFQSTRPVRGETDRAS